MGIAVTPPWLWDNTIDFENMKLMKKNTIKKGGKHHYGSQGHCFSFGLRNAFHKKIDKVTIAGYAGDEKKNIHEYKTYLWEISKQHTKLLMT
jgi:hypothetical protein